MNTLDKQRFEPSAETLRLREWLADRQPDSQFTWQEIEESTGVLMNANGKSKLRTAAKSECIEYSTVRNHGIVVAGPQTGATIIEGRVHCAKRAIQRTHKSHNIISSRHLAEMSEQDQKRVVMIGAIFGAMEAASNRLKNGREMPIIVGNHASPILPDHFIEKP